MTTSKIIKPLSKNLKNKTFSGVISFYKNYRKSNTNYLEGNQSEILKSPTY